MKHASGVEPQKRLPFKAGIDLLQSPKGFFNLSATGSPKYPFHDAVSSGDYLGPSIPRYTYKSRNDYCYWVREWLEDNGFLQIYLIGMKFLIALCAFSLGDLLSVLLMASYRATVLIPYSGECARFEARNECCRDFRGQERCWHRGSLLHFGKLC